MFWAQDPLNGSPLKMYLIFMAKMAINRTAKARPKVSKVFVYDQPVVAFRLDPFLETADTDLDNNSWPRVMTPTRYQLYRQEQKKENPMQRQLRLEQLERGN